MTLQDTTNEVTLTPNVNSIYNTCFSQVNGVLFNDDLITDDILSIDVLDNTITATALQINGGPASFPFSIGGLQVVTFGFTLSPSGTITNADSIKFTINAVSGSYEYTYDFLEIDPMSAFSTMPNPNDLGTIAVGSSNTLYLYIDNQTCFTYDYDFSTDLPESTWLNPSPTQVVYRGADMQTYYFTPSVPYPDLSLYSIFLDTGCITPSLPFAGQVIAPPVASGVSKICISNSITFS